MFGVWVKKFVGALSLLFFLPHRNRAPRATSNLGATDPRPVYPRPIDSRGLDPDPTAVVSGPPAPPAEGWARHSGAERAWGRAKRPRTPLAVSNLLYPRGPGPGSRTLPLGRDVDRALHPAGEARESGEEWQARVLPPSAPAIPPQEGSRRRRRRGGLQRKGPPKPRGRLGGLADDARGSRSKGQCDAPSAGLGRRPRETRGRAARRRPPFGGRGRLAGASRSRDAQGRRRGWSRPPRLVRAAWMDASVPRPWRDPLKSLP